MSNIKRLLALQEHDGRIRGIKKELRDIPVRKDQETARLSGHKTALAEAEETMKVQQATVKELELEITARHDKIAKLRQQQFDLKTNKEFKAMDKEIEAVQAQIASIEERELGLMETVESAKSNVAEKSQELAKEDSMVAVDVTALDERSKIIEAELTRLEGDRPGTLEGITPEWLIIYERVFTRKNPAVVQLEDGICGGCHMKLPPQIAQNVKKQTSPVCCDYCARILY